MPKTSHNASSELNVCQGRQKKSSLILTLLLFIDVIKRQGLSFGIRCTLSLYIFIYFIYIFIFLYFLNFSIYIYYIYIFSRNIIYLSIQKVCTKFRNLAKAIVEQNDFKRKSEKNANNTSYHICWHLNFCFLPKHSRVFIQLIN